jgi:putative SOS response-associated peptidase YedK
MCGRYYRRSDKQRIAEAFKLGRLPEDFELPPDWNIAPTTNQPIIRPDPETGEREMVLMRWGLVPAKIADPDAFKTYTRTNARAESILSKPIWKGPFSHWFWCKL